MSSKKSSFETHAEDTARRHTKDFQKLQFSWEMLFPTLPVPDDQQFWIWLRVHGFNVEKILWGFGQTAMRFEKSAMAFDHAVRYASAAIHRYHKLAPVEPSLPDAKFFSESSVAKAA